MAATQCSRLRQPFPVVVGTGYGDRIDGADDAVHKRRRRRRRLVYTRKVFIRKLVFNLQHFRALTAVLVLDRFLAARKERWVWVDN